jgi:hypothetical protein
MSAFVLPIVNPAKPIILYDNLLTYDGATVTASSEVAGFPFENAFDWNPSTYWLASAGTSYLNLTLTISKYADSFCLYSQTLWSNGGTIQLQYSLDGGSTWLDAFSPVAPSDNVPIFLTFDPISADKWRVKVVSSPASYIGVVCFGSRMVFERGFFVGFAPPQDARMDEITNNVSMNGTFVGRSLLAKGIKDSLSTDMLSQQWVRSVWRPFVDHARLMPFFLQWNKDQWPYEVAFCWADGNIPAAKNVKAGAGFMSISLNFSGNIS